MKVKAIRSGDLESSLSIAEIESAECASEQPTTDAAFASVLGALLSQAVGRTEAEVVEGRLTGRSESSLETREESKDPENGRPGEPSPSGVSLNVLSLFVSRDDKVDSSAVTVSQADAAPVTTKQVAALCWEDSMVWPRAGGPVSVAATSAKAGETTEPGPSKAPGTGVGSDQHSYASTPAMAALANPNSASRGSAGRHQGADPSLAGNTRSAADGAMLGPSRKLHADASRDNGLLAADAAHPQPGTEAHTTAGAGDVKAGPAAGTIGGSAGEYPTADESSSSSDLPITPDGSSAHGSRGLATADDVTGGGSAQPPSVDAASRLGDGDPVGQIVSRARLFSTLSGQGVHLRLDPPELGTIRVRLVVESGQVALQVTAETASARDAIQSGWTRLQDSLADHGLRAERLVVDLAPPQAGVGGSAFFGHERSSHHMWRPDAPAPTREDSARPTNGTLHLLNREVDPASLIDYRV